MQKGSILRYSTLFSQWISMRLRKKILGLAIIIFGLWGCWSFLGVSVASPVYAANDTVNTPSTTMEDDFRKIADYFLKVAYIILWPLIMLSGLALDNTMVYGEIFHMDAPLRQFWNLCKNFANFGLWFMILYEIIKSVLTFTGASKPMKTIQKAVIAGIFIQMSWFLVAALIDISTIATYAVGGMPMSILKTDTNIIQTKIMQPDVTMNLNSEKIMESKDFIISYQVKKSDGTTILLPQCDVKPHNKQSYIVGRKYGDEKFRNQKNLDPALDEGINACVYLGEVHFFYEFPDLVPLTGQAYKTALTSILNTDQRNVREACGYVIKLGNGSPTTTKCSQDAVTIQSTDKDLQKRFNEMKETKVATGAGKNRFQNSAATSIDQIIGKSKWFVGPLATIYTSMMDFANLTDTSNANGSERKGVGELIIRTAVAAGLLFPLLALTVVLIIRIGFLRCIIAASPLIILIKVFELWGKIGDIGKKIDITNILQAIFAPVITVFALSMGLIFMTALQSTYKTGGLQTGLSAMGITQTIGTEWDTYDTMNIFGIVLRYPKSMNTYAGATGDWFSWMIICFSGIGIMRFILFAAIKASGTIGEIWDKIKDFWVNAITTAPIPIPGLGNAGVWTLFNNFSPTKKWARDNASAAWDNKYAKIEEQNDIIKNAFKKDDNTETETKTKEITTLITKGDYTGARTKLAGDGEKKWDQMMSVIGTNKDIETFITEMKDKDEKAKLLTSWGIKDQRENKEKKEGATKTFEALITTAPKDKTALTDIIKKTEASDLAKADANYTKDIKTSDGKEYTIKAKNNVLEVTDKTK